MCPIYLCVVGPLAVLMQVPKATDKTCSGARTDGTDAVSYRPLCYRSARSDTYAVPSVYRNDPQRLRGSTASTSCSLCTHSASFCCVTGLPTVIIMQSLQSTGTILHGQGDARRQRHTHSTQHSAEGFCCIAGLPVLMTCSPFTPQKRSSTTKEMHARRQRHAHSTQHSAEGFCCIAGLPAVVTLAPQATDKTYDGVPMGEACRQLEELGADVVGLNCHRGPRTTLPLMEEVRRACKVNVKGLFFYTPPLLRG